MDVHSRSVPIGLSSSGFHALVVVMCFILLIVMHQCCWLWCINVSWVLWLFSMGLFMFRRRAAALIINYHSSLMIKQILFFFLHNGVYKFYNILLSFKHGWGRGHLGRQVMTSHSHGQGSTWLSTCTVGKFFCKHRINNMVCCAVYWLTVRGNLCARSQRWSEIQVSSVFTS